MAIINKHFFGRLTVLPPGESIPNPGTIQLSTKRFGRREVEAQLHITDVKKVFIIFPFHAQGC